MDQRAALVALVAAGAWLLWRAQLDAPAPGDPAVKLDPPARGIADLASAIAVAEGFGVPGAKPTRQHNPGDLVLGGSVETFPTDYSGWQALYHQLEVMRAGRSAYYQPWMSIADVAAVWTATEPEAWAANVVDRLRTLGHDVSLETPIGDVLNVV